jgi:hypothetical protein
MVVTWEEALAASRTEGETRSYATSFTVVSSFALARSSTTPGSSNRKAASCSPRWPLDEETENKPEPGEAVPTGDEDHRRGGHEEIYVDEVWRRARRLLPKSSQHRRVPRDVLPSAGASLSSPHDEPRSSGRDFWRFVASYRRRLGPLLPSSPACCRLFVP